MRAKMAKKTFCLGSVILNTSVNNIKMIYDRNIQIYIHTLNNLLSLQL